VNIKTLFLAVVLSIVLFQNVSNAGTESSWDRYTSIVNDIRIIHLPAGVFNISETIRLPSHTILEGEGNETILRIAPSFRGSRFITNREFLGRNTNILLRNFQVFFDMHSSLVGESPGILRFENVQNLEIINLTMKIDSQMYGIDLAGDVINAKVEQCTISNSGSGGGIMIRNRYSKPSKATTFVTVRDNSILSVRDEPLAVFGWLGQVNNIRLEGNTVVAVGASFGITAYGIDSRGQTGVLNDVIITKNAVRGGRHGAIGIKGGAKNILVQDNNISKAAGDGIFIHSGGEHLPDASCISVKGNEITDSGRHGILATGSDIIIDTNKISNNKACGIFIHGIVSVTENLIENSRPGILVDGGERVVIRRNIFHNAPLRILDKSATEIEDNINE
jgi:hypothetical protein